jgi:hypothetical protein
MSSEFQQYRYARIEAQNITRARLETKFRHGVTDRGELENAIAQLLAAEQNTYVPWRRSEIEQAGSYDGMRLAALEFFWSRRQEFRHIGHCH